MSFPLSSLGPLHPYNVCQTRSSEAKMAGRTNLGSAEDDHGPSGLDDRLVSPSGLLDALDLVDGPFDRSSEILIDVLEIFDDTDLVSITTEKKDKGVHSSFRLWRLTRRVK